MRILHYSLGFPPYRSGGMTKFCVDLMGQQYKDGHEVSLLWPGQMLGRKVRIKQRKPVDHINSYEIINPLPVPYDEGIVDIEAFTKTAGKKAYIRFLKDLAPDVIHLHTFMGLHSSFLRAARALGIRTVFTTHDFFPICPKVKMYRKGRICESVISCSECPSCNSTALGLNKIRILQSSVYRLAKEFPLVKIARKHHRDQYLNENVQEDLSPDKTPADYKRLRSYYASMIKMTDLVHYNSSVTKMVYDKVFHIGHYKIIPITHSAIRDFRKARAYSDDILRIRYLGPQGGVKGFFILKKALDQLWKEKKDFRLDIHFDPVKPSPYMRVHGRYGYDDLEKIFEETDILAAPSIWYETFGYTVLEALSFGVPVIISGTVGAKDILAPGTGIVIDNISSDRLSDAIKSLSPDKLKKMNENIMKSQQIMTLKDMSDQIMQECYMEG